MAAKIALPIERIENRILFIRGLKVLLDADLASLYGVQTRVLNQAVKRNAERFPADFMFQLSAKELEDWRSQVVISNPDAKMGLRRAPFVFTEHGALMAASLLNSPRAIETSLYVVRAFVRLREVLALPQGPGAAPERAREEALLTRPGDRRPAQHTAQPHGSATARARAQAPQNRLRSERRRLTQAPGHCFINSRTGAAHRVACVSVSIHSVAEVDSDPTYSSCMAVLEQTGHCIIAPHKRNQIVYNLLQGLVSLQSVSV